MLKDYPELIERLQERLNDLMAKPGRGVGLFDQAIWALEGRMDSFHSEAQEEIKAAEASGDANAIESAKKKRSAIGTASMNTGTMDDLWEYCEKWEKK